MGGIFKFQVQDSDLEYLFWQYEKNIALSEKNSPLAPVACFSELVETGLSAIWA